VLRILLADDHAIVRQGLKALLDSSGFRVVGEAADGREAARLARSLKPDVMVIDIGMPLLNGIECASAVRRDEPRTQIVALTMHADDHYVLAALRAGIRGYVIKSHAMAELTDAIEKVVRGTIYLSPGVSTTVLTGFLTGRETDRHQLTVREREVLQLVAEGKRSKEIADVLDITVKTAETHRAHIMDKLEIHDTAGLVRYAIRLGLISP
jgi:DNA-binding NarL/FixJ family response regulator